TAAAGRGSPRFLKRSSVCVYANSLSWAIWSNSAMRRKRAKSEMTPLWGLLAVTALGTPFMRSIHSRAMVDGGQLVSARNASVSAGMGVRNSRICSDSLPGMSVMVGRFAPSTRRSGRIDVNVLKITLLLLGLGARKNGRASAVPDNSYCAAMDETLRDRGNSL